MTYRKLGIPHSANTLKNKLIKFCNNFYHFLVTIYYKFHLNIIKETKGANNTIPIQESLSKR